MKTAYTIAMVVLFTQLSHAQVFTLNGTATQIGLTCYRLTDAISSSTGSAWCNEKIDLSVQSFDFAFKVYLGASDNGADGMVFTLQNSLAGTAAIGIGGGCMGYCSIAPSVGIELDTYNNGGSYDLQEDHMAFDFGGNVPSGLPVVPASVNGANIEDGSEHLLRVTFDAGTKVMKAYFDGQPRITKKLNINALFSGNTSVYWGFTAGTGGSANEQYFCVKKIDTNAKLEADAFLLNDASLKVYPNPVKDHFTIELQAAQSIPGLAETAQVEIVNLLGQVVYHQVDVLQDGWLRHDVTNGLSGMQGHYLVRVIVANNIFTSAIHLQ